MPEPHAPNEGENAAQNRAPLFPKIEEEIAAYWNKEKIFERSIKERSADKTYVFYDGPPFATGLPHYGHLLQSAIKDAVPRYWTMNGYRVPRVWGWDCHGLPIENLVEKDLRLQSKKDIEAYGIDKFNCACLSSVFTYEKEWGKYVERLGRWVDFEHSYKTMDDGYIESVWWVFNELHKKDLVYKGTRVSLYCPRCSTPLSNFEIAMGNSYIDREDPAIYVKFPVAGEEKTYFIAWTTTPWTLPANTGLSVHPDLGYVAVKLADSGETYIIADGRMEEVLKDYPEMSGVEVLWRKKGSELVGMRYEPLYSFIPLEGDGYRVVAGTHVTSNDGTGIVHTAPAFGEEDLQMNRDHGLPILDTVDDEGKMRPELGAFAGIPVKDADPLVVEDLKARGLLFRGETMVHSVPVCWRCNTLLLYKAQPAWFVNVTSIKDAMIKTAKKTHWHPEHFLEGRFGKGLETAPDWNVSRTRYWGSPIPVWQCTACDKRRVFGSVDELKKAAKPGTWPEPFALHRPIIDTVVVPCECGADMRRIVEVFDCWFESGSMPTASIHYPFENKKWFETHAPADFIAEAQDQTRGWFYTMHVLSTALFNKPAFENVIVTGMILAEDGKKMSKKLKNYPDPWHVLTTYGADALRYYLFTSPVIEAEGLNFSEHDLQNITRSFINLLWNVKTFYATYAPEEGVKPEKPRSAHILDRWLFSRFTQLLTEVTNAMNNYELVKATRPLRDFVDDLSTWWLRRSRDRMKSDNAFERLDALKTLREILEEMAKTMAPFMPFIAEKIYLDIGGQKSSVHLEKWPTANERVIDERLMNDMAWVRAVASKGHEIRAEKKIPVRQALARVIVAFTNADDVARLQKQTDLHELLRDELNVEQVVLEFREGLSEPYVVELDVEITPQLKRKGLRREFSRHVMNLRKSAGLNPSDRVSVVFVTASDEIAEAVQEGTEELARDLRADRLERVAAIPEPFVATSDVTIGGSACSVHFVS